MDQELCAYNTDWLILLQYENMDLLFCVCKDECLHLVLDFNSSHIKDALLCMLYFSFACERDGTRSVHTQLYLLMTITDEDFLSLTSNSNKRTQSHSVASFICLSSVLRLFEFPCTAQSSSPCSRAAGLWASKSAVSEPLSSLGFHEARRGCVRPHRHPGSPLCWWPLGIATSRRTSATSSQLLWGDACSQHPIKHSSQTNLCYRAAHSSGAGGGF